jgi:hypothetical protein
VSPVTLKYDGLAEFREDFRRLPRDLKAEGVEIVRSQADLAAAEIKANYPVWTGKLRNGVITIAVKGVTWGATFIVKSTGKLAWIFENGSQTRQYLTIGGHTHITGKMPPGHVFIPAMMRARRRVGERLKNLLVRFGLGVSGD